MSWGWDFSVAGNIVLEINFLRSDLLGEVGPLFIFVIYYEHGKE